MKRILLVAMLATGCNKEVDFAGPSADKANPVVLSDQEFAAAQVNDGKVSYVPAFGLIEEELTLKEKPAVMSSLRQQERPVTVDAYKQGSDGNLEEEEFEISTAGKVDLVVVVDDSNSMGEEQSSLAPNLGALTKHLKNTDWQIGVVTTNVKKGQSNDEDDLIPCRLQNARAAGMPIKKGDADPEKNFMDTVGGIGVAGSGRERGIRQVMRVVRDDCGDKWLRDDAALATLWVSDEESYCSNANCTADNDGPKDLVDLLKTKRSADKLKAYALLWNDRDADAINAAKCAAASGNGETFGSRYDQVINGGRTFAGIGGLIGSVCVDTDPATNDYEAILEKISKDVARNVKYDYALKHAPASNATMTVTVDGQPYADFEISGKTLKLKNVSGDSLKLKVSYRYDATAKSDRFALKDKAAPETIQVFVNDQAVDPARVTFDDQTNELVLMDMPPDDADVKLKYRKEGQLPSVLDLAKLLMNGDPLGVWVNGKAAEDFEFDATTGVISFKDPPGDGAEIKVSHKVVGGKTLRYVPGWADATDSAKGIWAKDSATGEAVDLRVEAGELVFAENDVAEGRKVTVSYDYGSDKDTLSHELNHEPIAGTLLVKTDEGKDGCITDVRVEERLVTYSCDGEELGPVTISYRYVMARYTSFEVSPEIPDGAFIQVYVDGQAIMDFRREGQTVVIPQDALTLDSKVRIIVTGGS